MLFSNKNKTMYVYTHVVVCVYTHNITLNYSIDSKPSSSSEMTVINGIKQKTEEIRKI